MMVSEEDRTEAVATLEALETEGRLTPEIVVEEASDPQSFLHKYFEWDDSAAAHKYRIDQARTLIRSVRVEVTVDTHTVVIPRYVRDPEAPAEQQGYIATPTLQQQPQAIIWRALSGEFGRAEACLERAENLADAFGMASDVTKLRNRLTKVRERAEQRAADATSAHAA